MPPAAVVAGAAIGMVPGVVGAATGAGKSKYRASNFGQTGNYDSSQFEFGGREGAADEMSGRMGLKGESHYVDSQRLLRQSGQLLGDARGDLSLSLEDRDRALADRDLALQARGLSLDARGQQGGAANMLLNRAQGRDLISSRIADRNRGDLTSRMRSAAASARGPAALANAQSDAMAAEAQGLAGIGADESIAGMQEQQAAELGAYNAFSGMREGDISLRTGDLGQQEADAAQRNMSVTQRGQSLNAAGNMAGVGAQYGGLASQYAGHELGVRQEQGLGARAQQDTLARSHGTVTATDSGTQAANAAQDYQYLDSGAKGAMGGTQGGAQAGLGAGTKAAKGGFIQDSEPVTVGEHGPEKIVPTTDILVVPNEADMPKVFYGPDGRPYSMTEAGPAPLTPPPREMKNFRRDTPTDQKKVAKGYHDDLLKRAEAELAAMQANLRQGPAVARDEGEIESSPGWLDAYMQDQGEPDLRLARREEGGPVRAGQPALVGEGGTEQVVERDPRDVARELGISLAGPSPYDTAPSNVAHPSVDFGSRDISLPSQDSDIERRQADLVSRAQADDEAGKTLIARAAPAALTPGNPALQAAGLVEGGAGLGSLAAGGIRRSAAAAGPHIESLLTKLQTQIAALKSAKGKK